jgi:hypothetical protein
LDLYEFTLRDAILNFLLPLKNEECVVNLQEIFTGVYDRGSYDLRIDYQQAVLNPKLLGEDQQWVNELLTPLRSS